MIETIDKVLLIGGELDFPNKVDDEVTIMSSEEKELYNSLGVQNDFGVNIATNICIRIEYNKEKYVVYKLQDRYFKTKDNKRGYVEQLMVSKISKELSEEEKGIKSITKTLLGGQYYRVGKISNKYFKRDYKEMTDEEINKYLPKV